MDDRLCLEVLRSHRHRRMFRAAATFSSRSSWTRPCEVGVSRGPRSPCVSTRRPMREHRECALVSDGPAGVYSLRACLTLCRATTPIGDVSAPFPSVADDPLLVPCAGSDRPAQRERCLKHHLRGPPIDLAFNAQLAAYACTRRLSSPTHSASERRRESVSLSAVRVPSRLGTIRLVRPGCPPGALTTA